MVLLREENQDLRGKLFFIPKGVKRHLKATLSDYEKRDGDKNNDGYDRLVYLCDQERITMEEVKRIKNFFDNYKGTPKSDDYILNGGKPFSDWINRILKVATDTSKNEKEAKELMGLKDRKQKTTPETPRIQKIKPDEIQTKNLSNSISKNSVVKESKTIYITNKQLQLIKEAFDPKTFSYEELEKRCEYDAENNENTAFKYCERTLGPYSGLGGDRAVFDLTDDKVLKIEFSGQGWMQNQHECEVTAELESNGITIIPKIYSAPDSYNWMVCERVIPCRVNDFDHILGVPYYVTNEPGNVNDKQTKDFGNHTEYPYEQNPDVKGNNFICVEAFISHVQNKGKYTYQRDYETLEKLKQHPWFAQLAKLIELTGMEDFHMGNFGMAIRDGKPTIVVLDLGL